MLKGLRSLRHFKFMLIFILPSCSHNQFEKVLRSPEQFHGEKIEITGVFHERFEDNAIYLNTSVNKDQAIWVNFSDLFMLINTFYGLDGSKIRVTGIFNKDDKGHLGQYAGSLDEAIIITD